VSHYLLPEGNVQIAFSGGRTSAFMLHQIMVANGGIPDRAVVTFQNTGREHPATLDFVLEVSERWGVKIVWLEYRGGPPVGFVVVNHNSASRNGEPFADLIRRKQALPNQQQRFCTQELKIRTAKRYLVALGWKGWTTARGIRADERHRHGQAVRYERSLPWHPCFDAGVSKHTVAFFWRAQPFHLRLPVVNGNTIDGNCIDCFLKSEATLAAHARDHPEDDWSERQEDATGQTFSKRYSRRDLREMVERKGPGLFSNDAYLCQANGGECM
jgi:hypothetical protein